MQKNDFTLIELPSIHRRLDITMPENPSTTALRLDVDVR